MNIHERDTHLNEALSTSLTYETYCSLGNFPDASKHPHINTHRRDLSFVFNKSKKDQVLPLGRAGASGTGDAVIA